MKHVTSKHVCLLTPWYPAKHSRCLPEEVCQPVRLAGRSQLAAAAHAMGGCYAGEPVHCAKAKQRNEASMLACLLCVCEHVALEQRQHTPHQS